MAAGKAWLLLGCLGSMVLLGAVLAISLTWWARADAPRASGATPTRATPFDAQAPRFWRSAEPALLRSEAGAPNIAGIASRIDGSTRLVLLHGETGRPLWQTPAPGGIDIYGNAADVLLTFDPVKKLTRYDSKSGSARWSITVAGHVHDITFGPGCAAVLLGGEPLGIDTETGTLKACKPSKAPLIGAHKGEPRDVPLKHGDLDITGTLELDSKAINPAPPRFAIVATRSGKPAWRAVPTSLEPIWTIAGFQRTVALTPSGIFVFGRSSSDHSARWLLLDPNSGHSVYEQKAATKVEDRLRIAAAGPLVYVSHDNALEAIRAATGEIAWRVGD